MNTKKFKIYLCSMDRINDKSSKKFTHKELIQSPIYSWIINTGFNKPLILSNELEIVDGVKRFQIAKMMKIEKIPSIIIPTFEKIELRNTFVELVTSSQISLKIEDWLELLISDIGSDELSMEIKNGSISRKYGITKIQSDLLTKLVVTKK